MVDIQSEEDKMEEPWKRVVNRRCKGETRGVLGVPLPRRARL